MAKRQSMIRSEDLGGKPESKKKWKASGGTNPMVGVRVDPSVRAELRRIAKLEGLHASDILRWLLENFIEDYQAGRVQLSKKPSGYTLE